RAPGLPRARRRVHRQRRRGARRRPRGAPEPRAHQRDLRVDRDRRRGRPALPPEAQPARRRGASGSARMKVPFLDLKAQYETIRGDVDAAIAGVIDRCAFVGGPDVTRFEADFAKAQGVANVIGVGNGTDAIFIALRALGVGPGHYVATAASSFIATSE